MGLIDVVFGFILSMFVSVVVTAMFADGAGDCFLTRLVAICSFGGSLVILIAGIILCFI